MLLLEDFVRVCCKMHAGVPADVFAKLSLNRSPSYCKEPILEVVSEPVRIRFGGVCANFACWQSAIYLVTADTTSPDINLDISRQ